MATNRWIIYPFIMLLLSGCLGGGDDDDDASGDSGVSNTFTGTHQVLAFNDLGMHCADLDYSNFVILPPFNVVHGQVIERGNPPHLLEQSEIDLKYRAQMDSSGSINTTSQNPTSGFTKSNFWDTNPDTGNSYAFDLFGLDPAPDVGLIPQQMPGIAQPYTANDLQDFADYDAGQGWFVAAGIPILPIDDVGGVNPYPLMRITAHDQTSGDSLDSVDVVLPVASEADCQNCHEAGEVGASNPGITFSLPDDINDPNSVLQAAKENILLVHDHEHGTNLMAQRPVLCAECHYSAALDLSGTGPTGVQLALDSMSQVMHGHHGQLTDPTSGIALFPADGTMEETCYQCHPGKVTQCLRGAMGGAGIDCSDCHGGMLAVGGVFPLSDGSTRDAWIDEPRCESCHTGDAISNSGAIRLDQAWETGDAAAEPRLASNTRFAENAGELYRNSLGHGGVACEGCHGSTHAIWPNAAPNSNDNIAAQQIQGHSGTITECGACHTSLPLTLGGPHGMHNVNSRSWDLGHENFYDRNRQACQACHGTDLNGTVLSKAAADRTYYRDEDGKTINIPKGTQVGCYHCHSKP